MPLLTTAEIDELAAADQVIRLDALAAQGVLTPEHIRHLRAHHTVIHGFLYQRLRWRAERLVVPRREIDAAGWARVRTRLLERRNQTEV